MNIEETIKKIKETGAGYIYSWNHDQIWRFGREELKKTLPYLDGSELDVEKIEPVSKLRAFLIGVPWYHVGHFGIVDGNKFEKAMNKVQARNIIFHVPLPRRYKEAYELLETPFVIWNKIRGDKNMRFSGPYMTIIGEYEETSRIAERLFEGENECFSCVTKLFNVPSEGFERYYRNQNTFELYDATKNPKLRRKKF